MSIAFSVCRIVGNRLPWQLPGFRDIPTRVQEVSLESLRIPILKIGDVLIASIQVALHDASAVQFKDDLLQKIYDTKARGLIVDLTAVDVVDSFIGRLISDIASMAGLMGTKVVITGLQPAVAITLVELGLELTGVMTALNLEKGLAMLRRQAEEDADGTG
jgi:rsbT antagonist protein RsbS